MAKDKILFIISFVCLGLLAAFLFGHNKPPSTPVTNEKTVQTEVEPPAREPEVLPPKPGKVMVPFQLTTRSSVVQFLIPGSIVDIRFTSKANVGLDVISVILLKNIRVLGIGRDGEGKNYNEKGVFYKPNIPIEILLEMTPEESEILSYAEQSGSATLELVKKGVSYPQDKLVDQLLKSRSDDNFNSILATHMIQSLFPESQIKVISTSKGYIVAGNVRDPQAAENIVKILNTLAPNGEKSVVNLLEHAESTEVAGSQTSKLPNSTPCQRAVPIEINAKLPIAQLLREGTFVNVKFSSRIDLGVTPIYLTLLRKLPVLAIRRGEIESNPHINSKPTTGHNTQEILEVFVGMTPCQANIFAFALEAGIVSLELTESCGCDDRPDLECLAASLNESTSLGEFQSTLVSYMLRSFFPTVDVAVTSTPRGFLIEGKVPDPQIAGKIMEIFEKLVPGGNKTVVNMMDIQPQQVLLQVKFYEVSPSIISRVGVNWQVLMQAGGQMLGFGAVFPSPPAKKWAVSPETVVKLGLANTLV